MDSVVRSDQWEVTQHLNLNYNTGADRPDLPSWGLMETQQEFNKITAQEQWWLM